ncbi:hypothetical protein KPATCC21470_8554 [Kitasatospora purpeofusca]
MVTWRRAQTVLLPARRMPVAKFAEVTFTSTDRVHDVIHNFNSGGFDSLYPKDKGRRPRTFTLPERREITKTAGARPAEHVLPFSTCSPAKPTDLLVAEGVVDARAVPAAAAPDGTAAAAAGAPAGTRSLAPRVLSAGALGAPQCIFRW